MLAASEAAVSAGCRTQTSTFIDGRSVFQNGSVIALRGSFQPHGSCPSNCATIDFASAVISGVGRSVAGGANQVPPLAASSRSLSRTNRRFSQKPSVLLMLAGISCSGGPRSRPQRCSNCVTSEVPDRGMPATQITIRRARAVFSTCAARRARARTRRGVATACRRLTNAYESPRRAASKVSAEQAKADERFSGAGPRGETRADSPSRAAASRSAPARADRRTADRPPIATIPASTKASARGRSTPPRAAPRSDTAPRSAARGPSLRPAWPR